MKISNQITQLCVMNHYNMEGPYYSEPERNADTVLIKIMNEFLTKYGNEIKRHYTFILKYDNDAYSYIAFRIVRGAAAALNRNIEVRLLGEAKTPEEKEYFAGINPIGWRKAKKHKKAVLITGFNPIFNVDCLGDLSKFFIEIYNPLERIPFNTLETIRNYYIKSESPIYQLPLKEYSIYNDFFTYPIGAKDPADLDTMSKDFKEPPPELMPPFLHFTLSGTEKDYDCYDLILKSSKEGNIHLYTIPEDKIEVVTQSLFNYVDFRNLPNSLNIVKEIDIDKYEEYILQQDWGFYSFSYKTFNYDEYIDKRIEELYPISRPGYILTEREMEAQKK